MLHLNMDLTATQQFFLAIAVILIVARLFGLIARLVGQPPVVGEIIGGILLGPTLFSGKLTAWLFNGHPVCTIAGKTGPCPSPLPAGVKPSNAFDAVANPVGIASNLGPLTAIANVGLILFMFIVGYEVDRTLFKGRERVAISVSLGSIALPMVGGTLLGVWLYNQHPLIHSVSGIGKLPTALFVGAAMSVTAFPVLARILTDRRMHRTRLGGLSIASAAVDDIAAWTLLAVVVGIAGSETASTNKSAHPDDAWHIYLSPVYLLFMFFVIRPLLKKVNDRYLEGGRLTPDLMAVVMLVLVLSSFATEWLNVHFIFGAFIAGACMPRAAGEALRVTILERVEQLSVLVLLPVFFVISGVRVDLSTFSFKDFKELLAILAVAIGGKFIGAYLGARAVGVGNRQAGALATLMNTRGLTELIILNVGKSLGVLDTGLFSLMVVMAIVTTAMTGPLLALIYPKRLIERDIVDAERESLGSAAYRVLVVANSLDDTDLIDTAVDLAAPHARAEVLIARLVPQGAVPRVEVGTGLGSELLAMTTTLSNLHELAARGTGRGVEVRVHAKFSEGEQADDLTAMIIEVQPDVVLVDAETRLTPHNFMPRIIRQRSGPPAVVSAVAVLPGGRAADEAAALRAAAEIASARSVDLVLVGRRERSLGGLTKHGIKAVSGEVATTSLVVGALDEPGTHLIAQARPDDEATTIDDWAGSLSPRATAVPTPEVVQ
ncbi:cation:proton antiporter [uncultured Jatrophihabitans sp.]|uniref:cation:proton antiporter n=1 Tax=uncultured Jatrophihabitans sp. TaxID=1610747 RepID=UPI0035CA55AF